MYEVLEAEDKTETGGYIFKITGVKKVEIIGKNLYSIRQSGKFNLQIPLDTCPVKLAEYFDDISLTEYVDGVLKVYFRAIDKEAQKKERLAHKKRDRKVK